MDLETKDVVRPGQQYSLIWMTSLEQGRSVCRCQALDAARSIFLTIFSKLCLTVSKSFMDKYHSTIVHNSRLLLLTKDRVFITFFFFFFVPVGMSSPKVWVKDDEKKENICWRWTGTISSLFWVENNDEIISFLLSLKCSQLWHRFKVSSCILFSLLSPSLPTSLPPPGWEMALGDTSVAGEFWIVAQFWHSGRKTWKIKIDQKYVILFACN